MALNARLLAFLQRYGNVVSVVMILDFIFIVL